MKLFYILLVFLVSCAGIMNLKEEKMNGNVDFNKFWNYGDPAGTREKFNLHLKDSRDKDLDYILQLKTQIARTYSLKLEIKKAHELLDEVEKALDETTPVAEVRYYLERGRAFNSNKEKKKAYEVFISAYHLAHERGYENYGVDAAHMVAIAATDLEDKVKWSELGINEAKKSQDDNTRKWIGVFYNNMGWDLFEAKRYEEALIKFQNCEKFYQEANIKSRKDIARWSVAKTFRFLGRIEDSLSIQEALLKEAGGVDESCYTYEELGELYHLKNDVEKAKKYFTKSYAILSKDKWLQKHEPERLARMLKLAK